ncbi:M23 family metallopeptidase [Candidatus Neomarinimicrobiota bacterium]
MEQTGKLVGFLKDFWNRRYQFLIMSEEGGWTWSTWVKRGHVGTAVLILVLILLGVASGWIITGLRMEHYDRLEADNNRLISYRDKVRHVMFNSAQYGLLDSDLLQELELSIDLDEGDEAAAGNGNEREGGIFIDQIYINFLENVPTFPPVNGYVTRGLILHDLDLQVNHEGIDIAAPAGDIVAAAASGMVVFCRWTEDLGYMIILSHGDGYFTVYGHNQTNLVSVREWVDRGQPIGLVGDTGISQGPHLHFEIWKDGRSIDPRLFIDLYRKQDVSVETHG